LKKFKNILFETVSEIKELRSKSLVEQKTDTEVKTLQVEGQPEKFFQNQKSLIVPSSEPSIKVEVKSLNLTKSNSFKRTKKVIIPGNVLLSPKSPKLSKPLEIGQFLEQICQNDAKERTWKKYLSEHFVVENYNYHLDYEEYNLEKDQEKKKKLAENLYDKYVNPKGKTPISLSHPFVQKVKSFHEEGLDKGFFLVHQKVLVTLENSYLDYFNEDILNSPDYQQLEVPPSFQKKRKITASKNFTELLDNEDELKIFVKYCTITLGKNLVECYADILEYEIIKDQSMIKKIFDKYVDMEAPQPYTFNNDITEEMTEKYNSNDLSWLENVKTWITKVLSFEFYPRFLNSKMWNEYYSVQFSNIKGLNFEDKYEILKVEKDLSTIYSTDIILSVKNLVTNEIFKARKLKTSTTISKKQSYYYLDKPKHDNLIGLYEIMKEENDVFKETTMYVIANDTPITLDEYLVKLKESDGFLTPSEIYDLMIQITSGIEYCHRNEYFFEVGLLTEFNIYFSQKLDHVFVDTGFFCNDDELEIPRHYLEDEYGEEIKEKSPKHDIFSLGMIFLRLITLFYPEDIEELYETENTEKPKQNKGISKKSKSRNDAFAIFKNATMTIEKPKKFFVNIGNVLFNERNFHDDLKLLVLKMIDPEPECRPTCLEVLQQIQILKKKLIVRPSYKIKDSSAKNITEGWSQEQISFIFDILYRQVIKDFLRSEFCVESMIFLEDVLAFKDLKGSAKIEKAHEIFLTFLSARKSPLQVNVNTQVIKTISTNMKEQVAKNGSLEDDIFDEALTHVLNTMISDKYPTFDKTRIYKRFLSKGKVNLF
jgi:serine/threonine protein kinase